MQSYAEEAARSPQGTLGRLSRRRRELTVLLETIQALTSTLDLPSILECIVHGAAKISGTGVVRLLLLDEEEKVLRYQVGVGIPPEAESDIVIPLGESFSGQVAATGKPLAVADCREDPRLLISEHITKYSLISYLGLPVKTADRIFGVLVFNTSTPRVYLPDEIALLASFASQVALTIQNANLYAAGQRQLKQLESVRKVTGEITRELDLEVLLRLLSVRAGELMGVGACAVWLWDEEARLLVPMAWDDRCEWVGGRFLRLGEGVAGAVAQRRNGVLSNDYRNSPYALPEVLRLSEISAIVAEPLVCRDRLLGVIAADNERSNRRFTKTDQETLHLFATQAAIAIENARLYGEVRRELTRRKEAEEHLRKLVRAVEQSPSIVVITDTTGAIEYVNPKFTQVTGYTLEEVRGQNPRILKSDQTAPDEYPRLWNAILAGKEWRGEFCNKKKNGDLYWEAASISSVRDQDGVITHFIAVKEDITEQKSSQRALQRYRILADQTRDVMLFIRADGRILDANQAAIGAYGYFPGKLLGLTYPDLCAPECRASAMAQMAQADAQGVLFDTVHCREDGAVFPVEVTSRSSVLDGEQVYVNIVRDITERKRAEEALRQSQALLNATQRLTKVGGWEWDVATQTMSWTEEVYRIHEFDPRELAPGSAEHIARSIECYAPEDRPVLQAAFQGCLEHGQPYDLEFPFTTARGRRLWIRTTAEAVFDQGRVARVVGNIIDITERKQAEVSLHDRTQQLEAIRAVSTEISRELGLTTLLDLITRRAAELMQSAIGVVLLWDEREQVLVPAIWNGIGDWYGDLRFGLGQGAAGAVAQRREGLIVNDYSNSPYVVPAVLEKTPLANSITEPLLYQDRLLGVINVGNKEGGQPFEEQDQEVLRLFAAQVAIAIENARLYAASERRTTELEALRDISQTIMARLELPAVLEAVVAGTMRLLNNPFAQVILWEEVNQRLVFGAAQGREAERVRRDTFELGKRAIGSVAQRREPLIVNDYQGSPYAHPDYPDVVGTITVPVLFGERLLGVLHSHTTQPGRRLTPDDLRRLQMLATQAAIAIENARLHDEATQRAQRLEMLNDVTRMLTTELDAGMVFEGILAAVQNLLPGSASRIWECPKGGDELRLVASIGLRGPEGQARLRMRAGEGLVGFVAATRQPVVSPDLAKDPRFINKAMAEAQGLVSSVVLPLIHGEVIHGVLAIATRSPHEFTDEEMGLLSSLAAQAAIAIENARLFQQEQIRLAELEAVRAVSEEITRELDLTAALQLILERALALVRGDGGTIYLWDESAQHLIPKRWYGRGDWLADIRIRLEEGVAGTVAARRQGMIVNDFRSSPYATPLWLARSQHVAALAEPLLYRERLVGVITVGRDGPDQPFTVEDQRLLRLFAAQAVIAIENARLFAEVNQSYHDLQQAQGELVRTEKLRALGQMAAGVAHDLNNVLMAILGQVELLKMEAETRGVQEALRTLETAATDGAHIVHNLQGFARQQPTGPRAACDLGGLVRETVELTRPHWKDQPQHRGVTIEVRTALPDLPPILGNPPEIREALTNLILNAVDAMPQGGTLTLATRLVPATDDGRRETGDRVTIGPPSPVPGQWIELTVADTGTGMSDEVQRKIFEPFFTSKGGHGTGLGLAIVYAIMERHRGRIEVASTLGKGTTFILLFPAAPASALTPPPVVARQQVMARRILLIDDDPLVRKTIASLLRAVGHAVTEADGGKEGLALLAELSVDLVLTDLGMPEVSGREVARITKARNPHLPIVLLTGWGDQPGVIAEHQEIADRVVGKPFRLEELLRVIAELTGGYPSRQSEGMPQKAEV
jgi:PAS domain S-box-containing protein